MLLVDVIVEALHLMMHARSWASVAVLSGAVLTKLGFAESEKGVREMFAVVAVTKSFVVGARMEV